MNCQICGKPDLPDNPVECLPSKWQPTALFKHETCEEKQSALMIQLESKRRLYKKLRGEE